MSKWKKFDIAIIGGDKRTACMAPIFLEKGYRVIACGVSKTPENANIHQTQELQEAVENTAVLVFGIPFEKEGHIFFQEPMPPVSLAELQRLLRRHQEIFGGVIPESFRQHCEEREIGCFDFMKDEALTIFNAIATAEGAVLEALLHKDTSLHHSECLVLGYGRCGRVLAQKLKGLDARVTVCSRSLKELASAEAMGLSTLLLPRLKQEISSFEYVFNTIPALVLTRDCLKNFPAKGLIIDIASNRGGVDYEAAESLGIPARHCPGLPGKYAGASSARRLAQYVTDKIS